MVAIHGKKFRVINCQNWSKGEAAFAASNSNIVAKGNDTWIVTGGKKSTHFLFIR